MQTEHPSEVPKNPMAESIRGYRKFDEKTSAFINDVKAEGDNVQALLDRAATVDADPRMVAIARTKFQEAAMWLIRSAAKPDGLF
jgi:hypothetical protein